VGGKFPTRFDQPEPFAQDPSLRPLPERNLVSVAATVVIMKKLGNVNHF
jgi:hypothetical protein